MIRSSRNKMVQVDKKMVVKLHDRLKKLKMIREMWAVLIVLT